MPLMRPGPPPQAQRRLPHAQLVTVKGTVMQFEWANRTR
jgi:hypothetical protein